MKNNKDSSQKGGGGGAGPQNGKTTHRIKQFDSSVDLLSPPHLLGNMYIALCPKLCY